MIKFFRHIRKRLVIENRFTKYLLYAVGEILLVVIGILIALQINNANEAQKQNTKEHNYLTALQQEFEYNEVKLKKVMESNTSFADAAFELIQNAGPDELQISEVEFSNLFMNATSGEVIYLPSNGVLEEIISSGKLDIFKNQELKNHLSSWGGVMDKVRFQEGELAKYRIALIDLWMASGNPRQTVINSYGNLFGLTDSKFKTGSKHMLNDLIFESNLIAFIFSSRYANSNYYANLEKKIEEILQIIKIELA